MKTKGNLLGFMGGHLAIVLIVFSATFQSYSQCSIAPITIEVCDMETVDFDSDTTPDGIINLYTETGVTIEPGDAWESTGTEPASFALDPLSGDLRLWKLRNASDQYFFTLRNSSCPSGERTVVNLLLGPYAGVPATTGFFPVCDENDDCIPGIEVDLDLFETLESRRGEALPHLNGVWQYTGSLPATQYTLDGSNFGATIEDNGGFPIDSEDFTFTYTVGGIGTCVTEVVDVKITIVRPVFAGFASQHNICDSDISTVWDRVIDLRDNEYLNQEDDGGEWEVDNDQITNPTDSQINIKEVYDAFVASPTYSPGYGCIDFTYSYIVRTRSPICFDSKATVVFRIFEELKPFSQKNPPEEICPATDARSQLDLFDLIQFQPGFEYIDGLEDEDFVRWTIENRPTGATDLSLQDNVDNGLPTQKHRGTINLNEAIPGRYEFRYTVTPDTLCTSFGNEILYGGDVCNPIIRAFNPCSILSTPVILDILQFDYAGENTSGLNFCETDSGGQVSLRSLLTDNGSPIENGTWTDNNGGVGVNNIFDFPNNINPSQDFSFTHTTINASGCPDIATLEFTVFKEPYAGEDATLRICTNDLKVNLFNILGGTPDQTGTWFGPFGYVSSGYVAEFDPEDDTLPILGPGPYVYTVPGNLGCATSSQATVNVIIVDPVEIGEDINVSFCKRDGLVNLFSLLDRNTVRSGTFVDPIDTGALSPEGIVEFENLENGDYVFEYTIGNQAPCNISSLSINLQLIDLPIPNVPTQEFCILDAKRLEDIVVDDVSNFNWYPTLESEDPIIDNPLLLDGQIYYIASMDIDGCESTRLEVLMNVLNTGEKFSNGDVCTLDFQDGVSPNGDNQNDTFDLLVDEGYNIPEAFPDFDLKIYNRYGSLVYEGNADTEEFRGTSNTSVRLGDDLPSGTYFYIFSPNFKNNQPIQGSFYLSR